MESIKIQNTLFQLNSDNGKDLIRWGSLETQNGGLKVIAFKIDILEATLVNKNNRDFIKESNAIIERKRTEDGGKNVAGFMKKQAESLRKNLGELEEHAKIGLPWQRVGVYLFYASVLSVLIGIIF